MIVIISADHDDEPKDAADKEEEGNADADDADDADNDDFDGLLPVQLAKVVLPTCISISMLSIIAHRLLHQPHWSVLPYTLLIIIGNEVGDNENPYTIDTAFLETTRLV